MENRGSKAMALAALIVGVVGLTIGFAAFSATLTINSSATVTPNEAELFDDLFGFDKTETTPAVGKVDAKYDDAWTDISVTFTGTNQTKTVSHTIVNDSEYIAYGKQLPTALEVDTCEAAQNSTATPDLVEAACDSVVNGTVAAPASVDVNGTGAVTLTMVGPTAAVDGEIVITYKPVLLNYSTAQ